jgi:hypothetical protein
MPYSFHAQSLPGQMNAPASRHIKQPSARLVSPALRTMAPHIHSRRALLVSLASAAYASADSWPKIVPRAGGIDFSTAPPNLTTLGNNSLFTHWRPKAHFIAPNSWMNDPMTLWYKADGQGGGKFKASYQAHPNHVQVSARTNKGAVGLMRRV